VILNFGESSSSLQEFSPILDAHREKGRSEHISLKNNLRIEKLKKEGPPFTLPSSPL
jgi:hypothetical protein